jgi:hypothetical protein
VILAEEPSCSLDHVFREVGGAGGFDVASILKGEDGRDRLLLVDCKGTPRSDLEAQQRQALRIATAAIPDLGFGDAADRVSLVLLARWREAVPPQARRRPFWMAGLGAQRTVVPLPTWWWFQPFVAASSQDGEVEVVFFGRWGTSEPPPQARAKESPERCVLAKVPLRRARLAGSHAELRNLTVRARPGFLRASISLDASVFPEQDEGLSKIVEKEMTPPGWWFVGETNDKGVMRLNWEKQEVCSGLATQGEVDSAGKEFLAWLGSLLEGRSRPQ